MSRAQGALEFVLISVVMMLFFTAAFIVAERNYANIQQERFEQNIYGLLDRVNQEISIAFQAGAGYERDFYLPKTLAGIEYDLAINSNQTPSSKDEIVLTVREKDYVRFSQVPINGTLSTGKHRIRGGQPVEITTLS